MSIIIWSLPVQPRYLKGLLTQKLQVHHHLLILTFFQTCMTFCLPQNTKGDVRDDDSIFTINIHFLCVWKNMNSKWLVTKVIILPNISFYVFRKTETHTDLQKHVGE